MKAKTLLTSGAVLMAAWMTGGPVFAQSSGANKGESKSEQVGETGVPLPEGSPYSGTAKSSKSRAGSSDMQNDRTSNVRSVQQALKDKGFDPGPVDGIMGERTRGALRSFQTANNLQTTGSLNAETAEKLGVQTSQTQASRGSNRESTQPRDAVKSRDAREGNNPGQPQPIPAPAKDR